MRFINHTNSTISLYGGFNNSIILKPGEVSKSFRGNLKLVYQFTKSGSTTEVAIVREDSIDDKLISECPFAKSYVYPDLDTALMNLTVFNPSEESSQVTGESLNQISDLKDEIKELNSLIENKDLVIANLNKTIDTQTSEIAEANGKIERLNKEYQGYKSQVTVQITDLNTKLDNSKNQATALQTTINGLLADKVGLENELKEIQNELEKSKSKVENASNDNSEKDEAIKGLMQQVEELEKAKTLAEADKLRAEEAVNDEKAKLAECEQNLAKVVKDNANSKEVWNMVCQKFGITYTNGEWHCSYKGE